MQASITTQKNGMVIAILDAEAARVTFACVIFAARFHEEIAPLARIVERELRIQEGELCYAGESGGTR